MIKIDTILEKQLSVAGTGPVEAVVMLEPGDGALVPTPEKTKELADNIVGRACREVKANPDDVDYNVFEQMGSFAISAPVTVLRHILSQPEVAGALANQQERGFSIKPVRGKSAAR